MDIEQFRKCLGQRIKTFRLSQNYSQIQFCELIEIEQPNLSNIETGKTFPNYITLYNIIVKAKADPAFLFGFIDNKSKLEYSSLDYEIMDLLINLSDESKKRVKSLLEIVE